MCGDWTSINRGICGLAWKDKMHENKTWIGNTQWNTIGHVLASPELTAYNIYDTDKKPPLFDSSQNCSCQKHILKLKNRTRILSTF